MRTKDQIIEEALTFEYGGMTKGELEFLYDFCRNKRVLELGSMVGMSSYVIAHVAEEIHCVDAWDDGFGHLQHDQEQVETYKGDWLKQDVRPNMLESFKQNCKEFLDSGKMKMTQGWTQDVAHTFPKESFDVLFIDADHSRLGVTRDIVKYYHTIKTGDSMVFHDFGCGTWKGVTEAILDSYRRGLLHLSNEHWELLPGPSQQTHKNLIGNRCAVFTKAR